MRRYGQRSAVRKAQSGKSGKERAGRKRQDRKEQLGKYRRESVDGKERVEKSERKSAGREAQIRKYKKENIIIKIQIGKNRKQSTGGKVRAETVSRQACMKPRRKETVGRLPASCAWFGTAGGCRTVRFFGMQRINSPKRNPPRGKITCKK